MPVPVLSVIIPNLNSPVIDRTLNALINQTYPQAQFEVIVVGQDIPGLVQSVGNIRFFPTETALLPGAARNLGARQASGEILAFTDADCLPTANWLETLAEIFIDPEVQIVGGGVNFDRASYWTLADNLSAFYEHLSQHPPGYRYQLPSLNLALRADTFRQSGGFDPLRPTGEDTDLTLRLRQAGHKLHFVPSAVVEHRPLRNNLGALLHHGYTHGRYSIKMDPHHPNERLPWPWHTRTGVLLAAPFLAGGVLAKMIFQYRLIDHWYVLPAVYLAKLAWCLGAARHPNWETWPQ